jgi:RNA polymerase sigma factor (sigma-70 family)
VRDPGRSSGEAFEFLVPRARDGDEDAWRQLCARLKNVAWRVISTFHLEPSDAEDALASTFFRLADYLDEVRDPAHLPGWVAATAKREALAVLRSQGYVDRTAQSPAAGVPTEHGRDAIIDEQRIAMYNAFANLSTDSQDLLRLLTVHPPLSHREIGELMNKKRESIAPQRRSCLDKLREMDELKPFVEGHGV